MVSETFGGGEVQEVVAKPYRISTLLFLTYGALISVFQGMQGIIVPAMVARLAPASKVATLGVLTTLAAAATIVALLCGGVVSDRTVSRFGRRAPWLVISCAVSLVFLIALGSATTIWQLMLFMPPLWFAANFYQTVLTAVLPDRVPEAQRGFAASAMALGVPIGIFVGINLAAVAPSAIAGAAMLALPFVVATGLLVVLEREPPSRRQPSTAVLKGEGVRTGFFSAFASRDYALTFVSRFVLFLAYFTVINYLYYTLQDYVGVANLPGRNVAGALSMVITLSTVAWLVVAPITGVLSDRIGHTAGIVAAASVFIGAVMLIPALSHAWSAMLLFGVGVGLSFGIYFAVDLKLVSLVLPSARTAGRDIGFMTVAASGPTVIAPALAAVIIQRFNFPTLFAVGAALAIVGGLAALPIRTRHARADLRA